MTSHFTPYGEPLRVTLARTVAIAAGLGAVLAASSRGGMARWTVATVLALWPALGGHFVELWFLNWLRMRISPARAVQVGARVATGFVGGALLTVAMRLTAAAIGSPTDRPAGWVGGVAFIAIELIVYLVLQLSGRPSFYDGRG